MSDAARKLIGQSAASSNKGSGRGRKKVAEKATEHGGELAEVDNRQSLMSQENVKQVARNEAKIRGARIGYGLVEVRSKFLLGLWNSRPIDDSHVRAIKGGFSLMGVLNTLRDTAIPCIVNNGEIDPTSLTDEAGLDDNIPTVVWIRLPATGIRAAGGGHRLAAILLYIAETEATISKLTVQIDAARMSSTMTESQQAKLSRVQSQRTTYQVILEGIEKWLFIFYDDAKLDDASRRYLAKNRDRAEKGETHEERLTQHLMDLRLAWLKDGDNDETPHLDRALETMKMTINLKKQGSNLSRLHHNRRVIMMIFDLFNWGSEFRASGYLKVTTIAKKLIGSSGGILAKLTEYMSDDLARLLYAMEDKFHIPSETNDLLTDHKALLRVMMIAGDPLKMSAYKDKHRVDLIEFLGAMKKALVEDDRVPSSVDRSAFIADNRFFKAVNSCYESELRPLSLTTLGVRGDAANITAMKTFAEALIPQVTKMFSLDKRSDQSGSIFRQMRSKILLLCWGSDGSICRPFLCQSSWEDIVAQLLETPLAQAEVSRWIEPMADWYIVNWLVHSRLDYTTMAIDFLSDTRMVIDRDLIILQFCQTLYETRNTALLALENAMRDPSISSKRSLTKDSYKRAFETQSVTNAINGENPILRHARLPFGPLLEPLVTKLVAASKQTWNLSDSVRVLTKKGFLQGNPAMAPLVHSQGPWAIAVSSKEVNREYPRFLTAIMLEYYLVSEYRPAILRGPSGVLRHLLSKHLQDGILRDCMTTVVDDAGVSFDLIAFWDGFKFPPVKMLSAETLRRNNQSVALTTHHRTLISGIIKHVLESEVAQLSSVRVPSGSKAVAKEITTALTSLVQALELNSTRTAYRTQNGATQLFFVDEHTPQSSLKITQGVKDMDTFDTRPSKDTVDTFHHKIISGLDQGTLESYVVDSGKRRHKAPTKGKKIFASLVTDSDVSDEESFENRNDSSLHPSDPSADEDESYVSPKTKRRHPNKEKLSQEVFGMSAADEEEEEEEENSGDKQQSSGEEDSSPYDGSNNDVRKSGYSAGKGIAREVNIDNTSDDALWNVYEEQDSVQGFDNATGNDIEAETERLALRIPSGSSVTQPSTDTVPVDTHKDHVKVSAHQSSHLASTKHAKCAHGSPSVRRGTSTRGRDLVRPTTPPRVKRIPNVASPPIDKDRAAKRNKTASTFDLAADDDTLDPPAAGFNHG